MILVPQSGQPLKLPSEPIVLVKMQSPSKLHSLRSGFACWFDVGEITVRADINTTISEKQSNNMSNNIFLFLVINYSLFKIAPNNYLKEKKIKILIISDNVSVIGDVLMSLITC